jgi:hypothetical protein
MALEMGTINFEDKAKEKLGNFVAELASSCIDSTVKSPQI